MKWIIVKWWRGMPETKQPANKIVYTDLTEANRVMEDLQQFLPAREFKIVQKEE